MCVHMYIIYIKITEIITHISRTIFTILSYKNYCKTYIKLTDTDFKTCICQKMRFQMVKGDEILLSLHVTEYRWQMKLTLNVIFCLIFYHKLGTKLCIYLRISIRYVLSREKIKTDVQYTHQIYFNSYMTFYFVIKTMF